LSASSHLTSRVATGDPARTRHISTTGLLALFVAFSAGIHAALVPEHLKEMPPLGYAFIAAAAIGCVLACALISRPDDPRVPLLAGLFCLGQIATWALFVTVRVPGFAGTPEGIETIALVSKAAELAAVALAFPLALPRRPSSASLPSPSQTPGGGSSSLSGSWTPRPPTQVIAGTSEGRSSTGTVTGSAR